MPVQLTATERFRPIRSGVQLVSTVIGPELRGGLADPAAPPANPTSVALLCLTVAIALLLVAAGHGLSLHGDSNALLVFWTGVILLTAPPAIRVASPGVSRGERLFLLFLLIEGLFVYKLIYFPTNFIHHDEFLHWVAADDLMMTGRLFLSNPLLPIGPTYPALEIVTTAVASLTGLPLFVAGMLLLAVLRGTFVTALFLLYEKLLGSARVAGIACLVHAGCSTFVQFEAMFSYESLGVVLCALIFAVEALSRDLDSRRRTWSLLLIAALLASLAVTHHLSAAFAAIYLGALAVTEALRRGVPMRSQTRFAVGVAALAVALPALWMQARSNPLSSYLGPVIETGFRTLLDKVSGAGEPPPLAHFEAPAQPLGMRLITLIAILLTALGLATGFFRTLALAAESSAGAGWRPIQDILARRWRDGRVVLLALLALGFPVSVAFRLTLGGWELGNRMGTFVFFGVGLVVAVGVVHFWQGRAPSRWRRPASSLGLVIIVLGGVTAASIDPIRGRYRVVADPQSVEAMGIETALWTKTWLGPGNGFASDRINRLLLASYGRQDVRLQVAEGVDASRIFKPEKLRPGELHALAAGDIDFLLADLRLTTARPVLGHYFEPWEAGEGSVLSAAALLKFNDIDRVTRVYDNGWIVIYDVRALHAR